MAMRVMTCGRPRVRPPQSTGSRSLSAPTLRGDWIDGSTQVYQYFSDNAFVTGSGLPAMDVTNPATQETVAAIAETTEEEFHQVVDKAHIAYQHWRTVPVQQRQRVMLEYQRLVRLATEELARTITLEQGKTLADAKGDVFRGLEVVETACQVAPYLLGDSLAGISSTMVRGTAGPSAMPTVSTHATVTHTSMHDRTLFPIANHSESVLAYAPLIFQP